MPAMPHSLASILISNPNLDTLQRIGFIIQMADALAYLHATTDLPRGNLRTANVFVASLITASNVHWKAPEIYSPGSFNEKPLDVFAFAMVCIEIFTSLPPFATLCHDDDIKRSILAGLRPDRPPGMPEPLWDTVVQCWHSDPTMRPDFKALLPQLTQIKSKLDQPKPFCKPTLLSSPIVPLNGSHVPMTLRLTRSRLSARTAASAADHVAGHVATATKM
eukprot:jgi/Hompol1/1163/HPOL_004724-RA